MEGCKCLRTGCNSLDMAGSEMVHVKKPFFVFGACVCMRACACGCVCESVCVCVCLCMYVHTCLHVFVCVHGCLHTCERGSVKREGKEKRGEYRKTEPNTDTHRTETQMVGPLVCY